MSGIYDTPDAFLLADLDQLLPGQKHARVRNDTIKHRNRLLALNFWKRAKVVPESSNDFCMGGREISYEFNHLRMWANIADILYSPGDCMICCSNCCDTGQSTVCIKVEIDLQGMIISPSSHSKFRKMILTPVDAF